MEYLRENAFSFTEIFAEKPGLVHGEFCTANLILLIENSSHMLEILQNNRDLNPMIFGVANGSLFLSSFIE